LEKKGKEKKSQCMGRLLGKYTQERILHGDCLSIVVIVRAARITKILVVRVYYYVKGGKNHF
jgi:hypothetical protein